MAIIPLDEMDFGQTGRRVSRVGLGGEGVLRKRYRMDAAISVIEAALDEGLVYFNSAPVREQRG